MTVVTQVTREDLDKYTSGDSPCIKILLEANSKETTPPYLFLPVTLAGVNLITPLTLERRAESDSGKDGNPTMPLQVSAKPKEITGEQRQGVCVCVCVCAGPVEAKWKWPGQQPKCYLINYS